MVKNTSSMILVAAVLALVGCNESADPEVMTARSNVQPSESSAMNDPAKSDEAFDVQKSDAEWRQQLTDEEYRILRQAGTERAFTGQYVNEKTPGVYTCAGCGNPLFDSDTKFDSGTGWPSFYDVIGKGHVELRKDTSAGMVRTEVVCAKCGGHLGHVFEDASDQPTGLRYCINSAALDLKPRESDQ